VGAGGKGEVEFTSSVLPDADGIYEIRYHYNNQYKVLERRPLVIEPEEQPDDDRGEDQPDDGEEEDEDED